MPQPGIDGDFPAGVMEEAMRKTGQPGIDRLVIPSHLETQLLF